MFKLLVVEDDRELNRAVCSFLNQNGYDALGCLSANDAYDAMYGGTVFDLIISDIMMPEVDGFEFARTIRGTDKNIPILFMTARDDFAAKQRGFRMGIDDYMVKPIDLEELLLHVEALLRRAGITTSHKLEVGSLVLDADERSALLNGEEKFWDGETGSGPRTVDVYMTKLRQKFADCDDFEIVTVHGLGYKAVLK